MAELSSFEDYFMPPARRALDALSEIDQADVRRRVNLLCRDPWVDYDTKFPREGEGPERFIFDDGEWEMIYRVDEGWVVVILSLAPVSWERGTE